MPQTTPLVFVVDDDVSVRESLELLIRSAGWESRLAVLLDPERTIQKDLDIQEYTDPEHDPMIPYTLVLKPSLIIHSIYNGYWFWGRPSIADLWRDLRLVTSEIRPDWDLSAPGLRDAWNAGDRSPFHGWDKDAKPTQVRESIDR